MWGVGVGRDVPASGDTNEKSGEQEATSEVGQEGEGEGEREEDGDEDEEVEVDLGQRAAEDVEGDDVDTRKRRPMRMTGQQNGKINLFKKKKKKGPMIRSCSPCLSQNLSMVMCE